MNKKKNNNISATINSKNNCKIQKEDACTKDFLKGKEIAEEIIFNYIEIDADKSKRAISYDLKVGRVIKNVNKEKFSFWNRKKYNKIGNNGEYIKVCDSGTIIIKPQEMFIVVLKEYIKMPNNCYGIAYPQTRLCRKGIHVFNTGLIDPGYNGYLSTSAINFSNEPVKIDIDDVYLRLMVHKSYKNYNEESIDIAKSDVNIEEEYVKYVKDRIDEAILYPQTFLDIENQIVKHSNTISDKITQKSTNRMLLVFSVIALTFTLITLGIGYSQLNNFQSKQVDIDKIYSNEIMSKLNELSVIKKELDSMRMNLSELSNNKTNNNYEISLKIQELEHQIQLLKLINELSMEE